MQQVRMAETKPKRIIVDVDVGADDYLALLILLYAEKLNEVKIEAIICTNGNTDVDHVCVNVVRLLETVRRTDIPVYKGAKKQIIPIAHEMRKVHGIDGLGDLEYDTFPDLGIIKEEPAAVGLRNLVMKSPNQISLICVGPLTNLALAIRLYDGFVNSIKDLWIMGGNHKAVGNTTTTSEYNFYVDPEAAYIVFDSLKKPIFMLPWEACLLPDNTLEWRSQVFSAKNHPAFDLLIKAEKNIYRKNGKILRMCDALLAAAFLYPDSVIKKKSYFNATVELHGAKTRGQVVLDHLKSKEENVTIIEEINDDVFKELLKKL